MGEGIESGFSMIRSHAAFSKTSESHFRGGQMNDSVIDTSPAESAAGSDFLSRRLIRSKEVERQGMRHAVDPLDHFLQIVKYQDRHHRAENFFLHNRIGEAYIVQDHRFYTKGVPV